MVTVVLFVIYSAVDAYLLLLGVTLLLSPLAVTRVCNAAFNLAGSQRRIPEAKYLTWKVNFGARLAGLGVAIFGLGLFLGILKLVMH